MLAEAALSDKAAGVNSGEAKALLANFVVMTLCFSVNHGTVSAVIALSTSLLGTGLGSINLGTLWLMYVLTALIFATAIIQAVGPKGGLLLGTLGYCIYVASFLLAAVVAPADPVFPKTGAQAACEAISAFNSTLQRDVACVPLCCAGRRRLRSRPCARRSEMDEKKECIHSK